MRPLNGIVVGREAVKCENGLTITAHIPSHIKTFEKVYVCFNLYTNQVSRVISAKKGDKGHFDEVPQRVSSPNCPSEIIINAAEYNDGSETTEPKFLELSEPLSEEDWFWDSGVLELSEPVSEGETPTSRPFSGILSHHLGQ